MTFEVKKWIDSSVDDLIDRDMTLHRSSKKLTTMSLGEDGLSSIIERYNLEYFIEYFNIFNPSSNLPYHNKYHMLCMVLNCYEGSRFENLDESTTKGLIAGAIMHDFGHTGGQSSDAKNIFIALSCLRVAQTYSSARHLGLTDKELMIAENCIRATQYPYVIKPNDLSLSMKIIRDADLMQPYESNINVIRDQYVGLYEELKHKLPSWDFYCEAQFKFLKDVKWITDWGRQKAEVYDWKNKCQIVYQLLKG